jgi:hypothetical protein
MLVILGIGLASVCWPEEPQRPSHYDGDEDDAGIVQERVDATPVGAIASAVQPHRLRSSARPGDRGRPVEPRPAIAAAPLYSRAPPA